MKQSKNNFNDVKLSTNVCNADTLSSILKRYDYVMEFKDGPARVEVDGKIKYINKQGEEVEKPET